MERDLIEGQLRERAKSLKTRRHARATVAISHLLRTWVETLPYPQGEVLSANVGFLLLNDPDTTAGIDIAYISPDLANRTPPNAYLIEGVPVLAVEVLSPFDTHGEVVAQIEMYLTAGVQLVWIVDPDLRTVTVHRPNAEPVLFGASQELAGTPELPGFRVKVAELFGS